MKVVNENMLNQYLKDGDYIHDNILNSNNTELRKFTATYWLENTPAKRLVFSELYGDVLQKEGNENILDIGGSVSALTPLLSSNTNYQLIDILAHETQDQINFANNFLGEKLLQDDWNECKLKKSYDLVIANDIFPNVDQRLDLFLRKFLPIVNELRMLLTVYEDRCYKVKRCDADEILWLKAWSMDNLKSSLIKYKNQIVDFNEKVFEDRSGELYPNKRSVLLVTFKGEHS